jgi:hypothetical protein
MLFDLQHFKTTLVATNVEVITSRAVWTGLYESVVNYPGHSIDGFTVTGDVDVDPNQLHRDVCKMALSAATEDSGRANLLSRMRAWKRGARGYPRRFR